MLERTLKELGAALNTERLLSAPLQYVKSCSNHSDSQQCTAEELPETRLKGSPLVYY